MIDQEQIIEISARLKIQQEERREELRTDFWCGKFPPPEKRGAKKVKAPAPKQSKNGYIDTPTKEKDYIDAEIHRSMLKIVIISIAVVAVYALWHLTL